MINEDAPESESKREMRSIRVENSPLFFFFFANYLTLSSDI